MTPESIDLDVERSVLTVKAERPGVDENKELIAGERPRGIFSRQLILGDTLDTDHIQADYDQGVLRLRVPVADRARSRKIEISSSGNRQAISA